MFTRGLSALKGVSLSGRAALVDTIFCRSSPLVSIIGTIMHHSHIVIFCCNRLYLFHIY